MRNYFYLRQHELFNGYNASKSLGHSVPKGNERELIASEFLLKHLPPICDSGEGIIADAKTAYDFRQLGQTNTPQIDFLIYMKYAPALTFYGGTKIFFTEGVASVIEVKSKLDSAEIQSSIKHCQKVKTFDAMNVYGDIDPSNLPNGKIPYYVIAFESIDKNTIYTTLENEVKTNNLAKDNIPDGFFVLNPADDFSIFKDDKFHNDLLQRASSSPNSYHLPLYKGLTLYLIWLTLLRQIDQIKNRNFPYTKYVV